MDLLHDLNEEQREAVSTINGPVIVFAGAGSGKTRTLTYRIAHMIQDENIKPYNILAITFTNRATNEMKSRLLKLVGEDATKCHISTFHSFCARILRMEIEALGYSRHFSIIDDDDQLLFISKLLKEANVDKKLFPPRHVQKNINRCKCFDMKPEVHTYTTIYELYEAKMKEENLLDYEDLLIKVHEIFKKFPEILEKYQEKYKYISIDEFQDTNLIQYKIAEILGRKYKNIFVVGDDDQSIYSFRGTNYENMQRFKKDFADYKLIHLTENYRSTQSILKGCNALISNNKDREKKELFSRNTGKNNDVTIYQASSEKEEVEYVIDKIATLKNKGIEYNNIAILYRSSSLARNYEMGLIKEGIPYKIFGGVSYLKRREVKDMIAYLKLIVNHNDTQSFERIVNVPPRGIGSATVNTLLEHKRKFRLSIFDAIEEMKGNLPNSKYTVLNSFKETILKYRNTIEDETLIHLFENLVSDIKYREYLKEEDDNVEERLENLEEFKSILFTIEDNGVVDTRINKLEAAFDEAILSDDKLPNQKQSLNGITLSTIHSAKGLEFDAVFLVGLEEGVFPNSLANDENKDLEEERRIAYVGCTRAKSKLYLISSRRRLLYGNIVFNRTSRFLLEFSEASDAKIDRKKVTFETKKEEKKEPTNTEYKVGDKVKHTLYGEGIIIAINDGIGQICFSQKGVITKMILNHPTLSKIE